MMKMKKLTALFTAVSMLISLFVLPNIASAAYLNESAPKITADGMEHYDNDIYTYNSNRADIIYDIIGTSTSATIASDKSNFTAATSSTYTWTKDQYLWVGMYIDNADLATYTDAYGTTTDLRNLNSIGADILYDPAYLEYQGNTMANLKILNPEFNTKTYEISPATVDEQLLNYLSSQEYSSEFSEASKRTDIGLTTGDAGNDGEETPNDYKSSLNVIASQLVATGSTLFFDTATVDSDKHLLMAWCFKMSVDNADKKIAVQGMFSPACSVDANDSAFYETYSRYTVPEAESMYMPTFFNITDNIVKSSSTPPTPTTHDVTYHIADADNTKADFGTDASTSDPIQTKTITFNDDDDYFRSADSSDSDYITDLDVKTGYKLKAIHTDSDLTSTSNLLGASAKVDGTITDLYLEFEPIDVNITFILVNEDGTTPAATDAQFNGATPTNQKTLSLPFGSTIPVTVAALNTIAANTITVAAGKDITGAYNAYTNATTNTALSPTTVPAAAKTVYLTIGDATPVITYKLTGTASWSDSTTGDKTETVAYNGTAIKGTQDTSTPPVTTLFSSLITPPSGQAFLDWYTKDGTSDSDWGTAFAGTNITADQTVYAKFATARTVTYNANGRYYGSTSTDTTKTETVADGGNPTLGDTNGTFESQLNIATGYEFVGWFDTSAATGGTEFDTSSTVTGDKTVYARYAQKKAKVTFDHFSGTIDSTSVTIDYKPIPTTDPHYGDYDNATDTTNYEEDILADTTDGNIKLTKAEADRVAALLDITSDYTFGGWSTDGSTPITFTDAGTGNADDNYYVITADTTLKPIITKKGVASIQFKAADADTAYDSGALSVYENTKLEDNTPVIYVVGTGYHGAAASAPAGSTQIPEPTRTGYSFKGWFRTDDSSNDEYATTDTYSAGTAAVYEAQWDLDKVQVKFIDTKPAADTNYVSDVTYELFPGNALDNSATKAVDMAETPTPTTIVTDAPTYTNAQKEYSVTDSGVTTSYEFIDWYVVDETKYTDTDSGTGNKLTALEYIQQKITTRTDITTAETASILKKFNKSTTTMTKDLKIYAVYAKDTRITFTDTRLDTASKFTDIVYIAVPNSPAKPLSDTTDTKAYDASDATKAVQSDVPSLTDAQKKYTNSSKTYIFADWYTVDETAADIKSDGTGTYTDVAGFIAATDTAAKITAAETSGALTKFDDSTNITEDDITVYAVYKLNDDSKLVKPDPSATPDPIDPGAIFYEGTLTDPVVPYTREVTTTIPDKGTQTVFEYPVATPAPTFNPDQAMHPMVVPNSVDKVAAEFTPNDENATVVIYDSLWDDDNDSSTPDVPKPMTTALKTGTTATYTFENYEIDEVDDNTPTKIYVEVTASDGVTKTTYEFDILRLANPRIVLDYGNSPVAMIWRDEWSGWDDTAKQTAVSKFKTSNARNKYYPDGYVPAVGLESDGTTLKLADNTHSWTVQAWQHTRYLGAAGILNNNRDNYDFDPYAYFLYQGQKWKDGAYFKDEYGFHHSANPTFTLSGGQNGVPNYAGPTAAQQALPAPLLAALFPTYTQTNLADSTTGGYKLTGKIILPNKYPVSYSYSYTKIGDTVATAYTGTRDLFVLSQFGDVNLSITPVTNAQDGPVLKQKYATMTAKVDSMLAFRAGNVSGNVAGPAFRIGMEALAPLDSTYLIYHWGDIVTDGYRYYPDLWPDLNTYSLTSP